jgi:hypothetical protein
MLKVHANRNYAADQVRHLYLFPGIKSSVSGQYGEINFPTLVNKIQQASQDQLKNIIFIDTRIDSHFEINGKTASLKLPEGDDILENGKLTSAEIVEKEKALSNIYTIGSKVLFVPKKDERNEPEWEEEIQKFRLIKDCIEEANYRYYRFALDEHGPLTNVQVDEFLKLIQEDAWFHINSIVGGASAATLAVMKDIWNNASKDSLEIIIGRCHPAKSFLVEPKEDDINAAKKLERAAFLREFHQFTLERAEKQSWSDWKELQSSK